MSKFNAKPRRAQRSAKRIFVSDLIGGAIALATFLGFLGGAFWVFDLFAHFRVQYMQLCLILIGIALWQRRNKQAVALILLACLNYAFVLPLYFGKPATATEKPIRAMLINLNAGNGNTEQVLEAIRNADPDILLLEEVTPKWAHELAVLETHFPYRVAEPQAGCFGIMLLGKVPLEHGTVVEIGDAGAPSITADAYLPQGAISIIATHPLPPINADYSRHRNHQLAALPDLVKMQQHPVLLMGDLNTSPWSSCFTRLLRDSGLKNSMESFGFQPTWPANMPFLRIPLDHALHSPEIKIYNRMVGGNVGSDHFPVIVDFSVAR